MFTDNFLKVPIKEFNTKEEELTGKKTARKAYLKMQLSEISHYRQCRDYENENSGQPYMSVYMKGGDSFYVYLSLEEFENLLNNHQSQ